MLKEELQLLDIQQIYNILSVWGIKTNPVTKPATIKLFLQVVVNEFHIKTTLERLTPLQVEILALLLKSKGSLTLGEFSRKLKIPIINIEQELAVMKHLMFVIHKKNRERLTANLDKYYLIAEIQPFLSKNVNQSGKFFQLSIRRGVSTIKYKNLSSGYQKILGKDLTTQEAAVKAIEKDTLKKILTKLTEQEERLLNEVFIHGGALDIYSIRTILQEQKLLQEETICKLDEFFILRDIIFIDERYIRFLVIPIELFEYLKENPLFPIEETIEHSYQKITNNELDFILNLKRTLLFISTKGLTLSQSEKIRQVDLKRHKTFMLSLDTAILPEKSQLYQLSILIPILKLFNIIILKNQHIVLNEEHAAFLEKSPFQILLELKEHMNASIENQNLLEHVIFTPNEVPFCSFEVVDLITKMLKDKEQIYVKVIFAELIQKWVLFQTTFRMKILKKVYLEKKSEVMSALFYMQLFGLIEVEHPQRLIKLSEFGKYFFQEHELSQRDQQGGLIINPDMTIVGFPDKVSLLSIHTIKKYAFFHGFDNVYNFEIKKDSLQEAILMNYPIEDFLDLLKKLTKGNSIPESVEFSINEWSKHLPIVTIEEDVVLLETTTPELTEHLVNQLRNEDVIYKILSESALIIYKLKLTRVIEVAEKLEMIVQLIR